MPSKLRGVLLGYLLLLTGCVALPGPSPDPDDAELLASIEIIQDCEECPEMVVVGPGTFTMGHWVSATKNDAVPVHDVTFDYSFAVGRFEVTNGEWLACVAAHECRNTESTQDGLSNEPVVGMSWNDTQGYVNWLSDVTGNRYRLLSEAEWEYAARAGTQTYFYNGNRSSRLCEIANVPDRTLGRHYTDLGARWWEVGVHGCDDGYAGIAPAGMFRPNSFGLHDMIGNAREWTEDCYHPNYDRAPSDGSAVDSENCELRVLRGGTYLLVGTGVLFQRFGGSPDGPGNYGLRVARDMD